MVVVVVVVALFSYCARCRRQCVLSNLSPEAVCNQENRVAGYLCKVPYMADQTTDCSVDDDMRSGAGTCEWSSPDDKTPRPRGHPHVRVKPLGILEVFVYTSYYCMERKCRVLIRYAAVNQRGSLVRSCLRCV